MPNHTHSKCNSTTSITSRLLILILLASFLSSCGTVLQTPMPMLKLESSLVPPTQVPPTEVPTQTPTITLTPEPTVTPTEVPTPTEVMTPTPKPTVELDELGIRVEIPLGQGMTRQELKNSVQWFYDLSDWELNQKIEGNLWSKEPFPNDSRPRDPAPGARSALLKYYEDLGWYHSLTLSFPTSIQEWGYFNSIYLETTLYKGEKDQLKLYISAFGTKDFLGNRFVIYANTGLYKYSGTTCGDFQISTTSSRIVKSEMIRPVFNSKEGNYNLINGNRGDVVNLIVDKYVKDKVKADTSCRPDFMIFKGADGILKIIDEQIKGLSTTSAKDMVDSSLAIRFNKLPDKLSLENYHNFVGMVKISLPKH